jgi:hypothetical protein
VQAAAGRPIQQVKIVDAKFKPGQPLRGGAALLKDKLAFFKPAIAPGAAAFPQSLIAKQDLAGKQGALRPAAPAAQARRGDQRTPASSLLDAKRQQAQREAQTRCFVARGSSLEPRTTNHEPLREAQLSAHSQPHAQPQFHAQAPARSPARPQNHAPAPVRSPARPQFHASAPARSSAPSRHK